MSNDWFVQVHDDSQQGLGDTDVFDPLEQVSLGNIVKRFSKVYQTAIVFRRMMWNLLDNGLVCEYDQCFDVQVGIPKLSYSSKVPITHVCTRVTIGENFSPIMQISCQQLHVPLKQQPLRGLSLVVSSSVLVFVASDVFQPQNLVERLEHMYSPKPINRLWKFDLEPLN